MKKSYSIIALALLTALGAGAAERTAQQKRAIAMGVLDSKATRSDATVTVLKEMDALTVIGVDGVGFAVISNDDCNEAVLAVTNADFDADNLPDGLLWWLNAANTSLKNGDGYTRDTRAVPSDLPESVSPMLTCKWGQDKPFNNLCPDNSPTGCVATAMSQIMYYHKYPVNGQGILWDKYNETMIDFSQQTYDYDNMKDSYADNNYTEAQATAVATLMYHCGLTAEMVYSQTGSGSHGIFAAKAVATYFGYNKNVACRIREGHSDSEWNNMIYEELAAGRPILYTGDDATSGGHAFVFTGYDTDGKVYVNWGWNGEADGYYDFNVLDPISYQFDLDQNMLTGFGLPDEDIPHVSEMDWFSNDTDDNGLELGTQGNYIISLSDWYVANYNYYDFSGYIHLIAEGSDGQQHILYSYDFSNNVLPMIYLYDDSYYAVSYAIFPRNNQYSTQSLANGTYTIYIAAQDAGYSEITPVGFGEGKTSYYTLTKTNKGITLNAGTSTGIANAVVDTTADDGYVHVYTTSGVEVYTASADGFDINDVPMDGMLIVKKGGETTKVMKK